MSKAKYKLVPFFDRHKPQTKYVLYVLKRLAWAWDGTYDDRAAAEKRIADLVDAEIFYETQRTLFYDESGGRI